MHDMRNWDRFLIPYEQAVDELKIKFKSIRMGYRKVGEYSPIEFVTGRVKKISSIIDKSRRLNIKQSRIKEEMEDIAGIRVMCQLLDDIYSVVDSIHQRDGKDFSIVYEKDYIKNYKESGYRSYHVVIKYPIYTAFGFEEVLAEIQIRTLAMNFWAIIEHSLNYKYQNKLPQELKDRLISTAAVVWQLDTEMKSIKSEIVSSQASFEYQAIVVENITDQLELLRKLGKFDIENKYRKKFDSFMIEKDFKKLDNLYNDLSNELKRGI